MLISWFRRRRRRRLRARPFSPAWEKVICGNVPYYRLLGDSDRKELQGLVHVFLHEKRFEGCGGMVITDEVRVTIAAQACILLLHRDTDCYPLLQTILVYPSAYAARTTRHLGNYLVEEGLDVRVGESWYRGVVVLSWEEVCLGTRKDRDGQNVVFHEFAHQLDDEAGAADGMPALRDASARANWAEVLGREYEALGRLVAANAPTLIDPYGAESPAEFFAVATECFFEQPLVMQRRHPALYEQLRLFYRQDPGQLYRARSR